MTDDTNRSRRARERQKRTGERYTEALRAETHRDRTPQELTAMVDRLEQRLAQDPDNVGLRRELRNLLDAATVNMVLGKIFDDKAAWRLDDAAASRLRSLRSRNTAALVELDPDSDWAKSLTPGRNIFEKDRTFEVQSVPDPAVQAAWDRLAARDPRHREAAERYRRDADGTVDEVLDRWSRDNPGTREWLEATRAKWASGDPTSGGFSQSS